MNQETDFDDDFDDDFDTLDDSGEDWGGEDDMEYDAPPKKKSSMGLIFTLVILGGLGGAGYMYKDTVMSHIGPYIGQDSAQSVAVDTPAPTADMPMSETAGLGKMPSTGMMPDTSAMDATNDPFASGASEPLTDIPEIEFGLPGDPSMMNEQTAGQAMAVDGGLEGFEGVETVSSDSNIGGMPPQPGDEAANEPANETAMMPADISFGDELMATDAMADNVVEDEIDNAMQAIPSLTDSAEDAATEALDTAQDVVEEIAEVDALPTMSTASRSSADIEKIEDLEDQLAELRRENEKLAAENKKLSRQASTVSAKKADTVSSSKAVSKPQPRRAAVSKAINWEIRSASNGRALISAKGKNDMVTIREGQRVDGLGTVNKIQFVPGEGWQISTTEGRIIR